MSTLVRLSGAAAGSRTCIVIPHGVDGTLFPFEALMRALPKKCRTFGFPAPGLRRGTACKTVEESATTCYEGLLDEVGPSDPILIIGCCFGSYIGLALAHLLRQESKPCHLLAYAPFVRVHANAQEEARVWRLERESAIAKDFPQEKLAAARLALERLELVYRSCSMARNKFMFPSALPCKTTLLVPSDPRSACDATVEKWGLVGGAMLCVNATPGTYRDAYRSPAIHIVSSEASELAALLENSRI